MLGFALLPGIAVGASSSVIALSLSHSVTVTVGVVGIAASLATILGIIYGVRYRIAYEVERKAREGEAALCAALEDRVRTVAHERDEIVTKYERLDRTLHDAQKTIARLEALPNLERVLELVNQTFLRMRDRQEELHKENLKVGEERTQRVIEAINRRAA